MQERDKDEIIRSYDQGEVDLKNLPDRQIADRNSVYRLAGEDRNAENLQNLPDRVIADRNSPYRAAQDNDRDPVMTGEAGAIEDYQYFNGESTDGSREQSFNAGDQGAANRRGQGQQRQAQNQQGQTYRQAAPNDQTNNGEKENSLDGTVTLNTDPIDGPSKLDNETLK